MRRGAVFCNYFRFFQDFFGFWGTLAIFFGQFWTNLGHLGVIVGSFLVPKKLHFCTNHPPKPPTGRLCSSCGNIEMIPPGEGGGFHTCCAATMPEPDPPFGSRALTTLSGSRDCPTLTRPHFGPTLWAFLKLVNAGHGRGTLPGNEKRTLGPCRPNY